MASIYKRKNGTYCIRVSNGIKNGKQNVISTTYFPPKGIPPGAAEKGAREYALLFEGKVHRQEIKEDRRVGKEEKPVLSWFVNNYYYDYIDQRLSPNTVKFYRSVIDKIIIESFGDIPVCDLHSLHLQKFVDYLRTSGSRADENDKRGLAGATVKRYAAVFSSIMECAWALGFADKNALRDRKVTMPRIVKPRLSPYTPDEIRIFNEELKKEPYDVRLILSSALILGLRRAEIVALKWSDVDFEKKRIHILRSAYKLKGQEQGLKEPKSDCGNRIVCFGETYGNILQEHRKNQEKQRSDAGTSWEEQDFILTNNSGGMISLYAPTAICSRFEKEHGLRHLKLHGLRHTTASVLLGAGADLEAVKQMLGHESIRTTEQYLHCSDASLHGAAKIMEQILIGKEIEHDTVIDLQSSKKSKGT